MEREQWHLGYASLLRDCREGGCESSSSSAPHSSSYASSSAACTVAGPGRALILVHPDVDAMSSARILGYMLRADGVPYQMRPCPGWGRLRRVLSGMGIIATTHDDARGDIVEGETGGNRIANDDCVDGAAEASSHSTSCDVRAVVLVNMGANRNLAKLFRPPHVANDGSSSSSSAAHRGGDVRCYVLDCRRPYHLANVHAGKNVVLFNDRPFESGEVPSDGDDLSGDDVSSSSDDGSGSDDDDNDDDGGGRGGDAGRRRKADWEEDDDSDDAENEFELDDHDDGGEDGGDEDGEEDDDDDDDVESGIPAKRRRTDRADDPALDGDEDDEDHDDLRDSDEDDEDDDDDDDEGGGKSMTKKKGGGRRTTSGGIIRDPLNTTAATADLTMNVMDETLPSSPRGEDDDDDDDPESSSSNFADPRALRRMRRNRVRLHYSSGSYHGSPSSWTAYALARQLRFGDVPDLLWLACVGVTDAYLHGRLDVAGYSALSVDLRRHVGRLFPNDAVDRVGRQVYAEDLEGSNGGDNNYREDRNDGGGNRGLTQIGLSENGRILFQDEYKFMLLRHTSLWDSMLHSNFVASKMQVWKSAGRRRLMELLARMGFPLDQCRQPWAFVGPGMRRRLGERLRDCTEVSFMA